MIHVCLCEQEPKISVPIVWYRQNRRKKSSRWLVEEQIGGLIPEVGKQIDRVRNHGGHRSVGEPKDSQFFEGLQRTVSR